MNIQWFPGHMAKTRRLISENLRLVDVVVELQDARIPYSSTNPVLNEIIGNKPRVIALNKCDMADPENLSRWVEFYKKEGVTAIPVDSIRGTGIGTLKNEIRNVLSEKIKRAEEKGMKNRDARMMVVGIPNVGKSSFINKLSGRAGTKTGDRPGITTSKQWIRINEQIELLDTPGVLWPKFESNEVALNLAFTGTIKDNLLEIIEVAYSLTKFLIENYRERFLKRYKLDDNEVNEILNNKEQEENQNIYEIMQLIGKKRGAIMSGGYIDDEKTSKIIIEDFRTGKLGRITIEKC